MTTERDTQQEVPPQAGWDAPDEDRLRRVARVPLAEKLAWLETMHRMALTLRAARRRRAIKDA